MSGTTEKHYPHVRRGRRDAFPTIAAACDAAQDEGQALPRKPKPAEKRRKKVYLAHVYRVTGRVQHFANSVCYVCTALK